MRLIIDIPEDDYELVQKYIYPQRVFYELTHGTPIPDNATNGDIIKTLFPQEGDFETDFDTDWWNSPYKRGETE